MADPPPPADPATAPDSDGAPASDAAPAPAEEEKTPETDEPPASGEEAAVTDATDGQHQMTDSEVKESSIKTACLFFSYVAMGMMQFTVGATFTNLLVLYDTDMNTLQYAFTGNSSGFVVGSLIAGVVFDRANKELYFVITLVLMGVCCICAPLTPVTETFIVVITLQGVVSAMLVTGGASYCMTMWAKHRLKEPLIQAANAVWSFGAMICPFICRPFLTNVPEERNSTIPLPDVSNVRHAFFITGGITIVAGLLFAVPLVLYMSPLWTHKQSKLTQDETCQNEETCRNERHFRMILMVFVFFFYICYAYSEGVPGNFLAVFAVKQLGFSSDTAPLTTSTLFGCHFGGRVLGVPLSFFLKPVYMLAINIPLTTLGYIILLFVNINHSLIWVGAAIAGYGMSTTFAGMLCWVSERMPITGAVASIIFIGLSTGGITSPIVVGNLFRVFTPMCMVYVLVTVLGVQCFLYAGMNVLALKHKNQEESVAPA